MHRLQVQLLAVTLSLVPLYPLASEFRIELPVICDYGTTCFFQNFVDLDPRAGISDPWCGNAAYEEHKGTDIRVLTIKDISKNYPVVAVANGTVKAVRDGIADRLFKPLQDKSAVSGKECGNGVVLQHSDGYESQYCHMKRGSVAVEVGDNVYTGERLGHIGNSGFAEFPHLHLTMRKNGVWFDPVSGRYPGTVCKPATVNTSYFSKSAFQKVPTDRRQILTGGLTSSLVEHASLVRSLPKQVSSEDDVIVGWAWLINLSKGDQVKLRLTGPGGFSIEHTTDALDRHKASYSAYAGRRRSPEKGHYQLEISVLNNAIVHVSKKLTFELN
ncbi:MAG: M23 family metallopeptidase [Pseudomonadota bacterium]